MKLRKEIEKAIREANGDRAIAALAICALLEEKMKLAEKGWFDDDPLLLNALKDADQIPALLRSAA